MATLRGRYNEPTYNGYYGLYSAPRLSNLCYENAVDERQKNTFSYPLFSNPFDLTNLYSNCLQTSDGVFKGQHDQTRQHSELNNNKFSELEFDVMKILSSQKQCELVEVQKRLVAVTSPKVLENTMDLLVSKGHVQVVSTSPKTWAKIGRHHNELLPGKLPEGSGHLGERIFLPDSSTTQYCEEENIKNLIVPSLRKKPTSLNRTASDFILVPYRLPADEFQNHYNYRERSPVTNKERRDPGVIGEERFNRNNRNKLSPSFDDETLKVCSKTLGFESDSKSCSLCKMSFHSQQDLDEHFQSTKHLNKIAKFTSDPYPRFCDYCKVGLNSKSQAQEHFASGRHEQTVAKSQKAPIRNHVPIAGGSREIKPLLLTKTEPNEFQIEMYMEAMSSNCVSFLPTGEGNQLVSALVVAHMLTLNPSRQVIFLVDRVLLVIHQSDYLKHELEDLRIPLLAKDDEHISSPTLGSHYQNRNFSRPIRIGAICGEMRKLEQGVPVFSHDILVVTADCYRNHINNGTLRFEDSALVILDEAHHCNKDHPYNVIIRDYFLPEYEIPAHDRPKILGLTASPAGESTLDRTVKKLQRLLVNLGGATLLPISGKALELSAKTRKCDIVFNRVDYSPSEKVLLAVLIEYCTKCFNLAGRVSDLKEYKDIFQPSSGGVLSKEDIGPVLEIIDKMKLCTKHRSKSVNSLLHFQAICETICALQECGEKVALDRLMELADCACLHGFEWAKEQGLPYESLKTSMEHCSAKVFRSSIDVGSSFSSLADLLLEVITKEIDVGARTSSQLAVVLVKRSQTANDLVQYLNNCHLGRKGIKAVRRYESPGCTPGLTYYRKTSCQIVVTTYIDEKGLDLPSCKLVVQLDPTNAVCALRQIRCRYRDHHTTFAMICRDMGFPKKLRDLLLRESNLIQASQLITSKHDKPQNTIDELLWML